MLKVPKINKGVITLGVGEKTYDGLWTASRGRVEFTFAEELPAPHKTTRVVKEYTKWNNFMPYELGGQIVNEILENL